MAATFNSLAPEVKAAVWNVGGAGLAMLFEDSGLFSLQDYPERDASLTTTLFLGLRLEKNTTLYFDPEIAGGRGFSGVNGLANSSNGELPRVASATNCNGIVKTLQAYFTTGTANANDLACVTAANTVAGCSGTTVGQFVGVIDSVSTNTVYVASVSSGTHIFNATSATFTNGHWVCQSSAAADLVVDSATVCGTGAGIGIYIGATGTQTAPLVAMRTF